MALSGNFSEYAIDQTQYRFGIIVEWSASQSSAGNYSDLTINVIMDQIGGVAQDVDTPITLTVNGDDAEETVAPFYIPNTAQTNIKTFSFRVYHNSTGQASVSMEVFWECDVLYRPVASQITDITATGSFTLDTIPKVTQITVSPTTAAIGTTVTMTTTRPASGLVNKLYYTLGGNSTLISDNVGDSYSWLLAPSLADEMSSDSETMTITCETYLNGVKQGQSTATLTVTRASDARPTNGTMSYVTTGVSPSGALVQNYTGLTITFTGAAAQNGKTVTLYRVRIGNITQTSSTNTVTFPTLTEAMSPLVYIYDVQDSAGVWSQAGTVTTAATVYEYYLPEVQAYSNAYNEIVCERSDQYGNPDDEGLYLHIMLSAYHAAMMASGSDLNTYTLYWRYSIFDSGSWSSWATLTPDANNKVEYVTSMQFPAANAYAVEFGIQDQVCGEKRTKIVQVASAAVTMHARDGGHAVAFGMYSTADYRLESAWDIYVKGKKVKVAAEYQTTYAASGDLSAGTWDVLEYDDGLIVMRTVAVFTGLRFEPSAITGLSFVELPAVPFCKSTDVHKFTFASVPEVYYSLYSITGSTNMDRAVWLSPGILATTSAAPGIIGWRTSLTLQADISISYLVIGHKSAS